MGHNHMRQAFPSVLRYTCRSAAFRFFLTCNRLAGIFRYVGKEDIQETYSQGQAFTRRFATRGAIPVWFFFRIDLTTRIILYVRHPKFVYTVGLYPFLHRALRSAPVGSRMAVASLIRWAMSSERAS